MGESYAVVLRRLVEDRTPAGRCRLDQVGAVHQQVRAPAVGHAVHLAVDAVPGAVLEERLDLAVVLDQRRVDRRHVTRGDQPQGRVPGRRDHVVVPGLQQADGLVGGPEVLHVRLAGGLLLEGRDPVDLRVVGAVLGVARPRQDVHRALQGAHLLLHGDARRGEAAAGLRAAGRGASLRPAAGHQGECGDTHQGAEGSDARGHGFSWVSWWGPEREICEPRFQTTHTWAPAASSEPEAELPVFGRETVSRGPASSSTIVWVLGPR
jgi:hypothetical protein